MRRKLWKSKDIYLNLCSNWKEVQAELGLSDEFVSKCTFGRQFHERVLNRTTTMRHRVSYTDTFTLVKGLEGKDRYTDIDDSLVNIVLHLNKTGIQTCHCCEGHMEGNYGKKPKGYLTYLTPKKTNESLDEALAVLADNGVKVERAYYGTMKMTILSWTFNNEEEKKTLLQLLREKILKIRRYEQTYLVFPGRLLNGTNPEELSDSQALEVVESARKEGDKLSGEYTFDDVERLMKDHFYHSSWGANDNPLKNKCLCIYKLKKYD